MKLKNGNVLMPKAKFIQEHKRLTKILTAVSRENQKQMKELREFKSEVVKQNLRNTFQKLRNNYKN